MSERLAPTCGLMVMLTSALAIAFAKPMPKPMPMPKSKSKSKSNPNPHPRAESALPPRPGRRVWYDSRFPIPIRLTA
ncbi:hypothetical protein DM46_1819 [Burkholderia mallei]|nr:hypothetical protein DM46_1819 [Burkholderia mallei]